MSVRTFESALVLLPPKHTWEKINEIRKTYDRAYPRWMPHINLIYPFLKDTEFAKEQQKIAKHLSDVTPFTISLTKESFGFFTHGKSTTIWVRPVGSPENNTEDHPDSTIQQEVPTPPVTPPTVRDKRPKKVLKTVKKKVKKVVPVEIEERCQVAAPSILGYPNPNPFNYPLTSGLEALRDALWSEDVVELKRNPAEEYGLDLLRYAVWGIEQNKKNTYPEVGGVQKFQNKQLEPFSSGKLLGSSCCVVERKKRIEYQEVWEEIEEQIEVEIDDGEDPDSNQAVDRPHLGGLSAACKRTSGASVTLMSEQAEDKEDDDGFTMVKKKQKVKKGAGNVDNAQEPATSQEVMHLQRKLYEMYPGDSLDTVNRDFNPHLTLGQLKSASVASSLDKWKQKWTDITFEVKDIHLISRRGQNDNFTIRKTVPFNVLQTNSMD